MHDFQDTRASIAVVFLILSPMLFPQGNWEDDVSQPHTWTTGKVGIGTSAPLPKLEVVEQQSTGTAVGIYSQHVNSAATALEVQHLGMGPAATIRTSSALNANPALWTISAGNGPAFQATAGGGLAGFFDGNVGIGTSQSYGKLNVLQNNATEPAAQIQIANTTHNSTAMDILHQGTGPVATFSTNNANNTQPVLWATNITGPSAYFNKEVGIGTSTPRDLLHIKSIAEGSLEEPVYTGAMIESTGEAFVYPSVQFHANGTYHGVVSWDPFWEILELEARQNGSTTSFTGIAVHNAGIEIRSLSSTSVRGGGLYVDSHIETADIEGIIGPLNLNTISKDHVYVGDELYVGDKLHVAELPVWNGPQAYDVTWNVNNQDVISREGSSQRYKSNIEPFEEEFEILLSADVKQYSMKEGYGDPDWLTYGLIAEELDELGLSHLVIYDSLAQPDGVRYKKISLYLLEIVKDLSQRIATLEQGSGMSLPRGEQHEITALTMMADLEARLAVLENAQSGDVNQNADFTGADGGVEAQGGVGNEDGIGIHELEAIPAQYELSHNYPNPFNPETAIGYALPEAATVRLTIFDVLGRLIKSAANGAQTAGYHKYIWDGTDQVGNAVASGTYLYQLQAGEVLLTRKMTLTR